MLASPPQGIQSYIPLQVRSFQHPSRCPFSRPYRSNGKGEFPGQFNFQRQVDVLPLVLADPCGVPY